jgi:integrase
VRFLAAAPGLKYKAALSVAYGAGLLANEVISLKVNDIDSKRMLIRVEQGKDRYVMPAMPRPSAGRTTQRAHPRFPPLEAFGRRSSVPAAAPSYGRHPKPFT